MIEIDFRGNTSSILTLITVRLRRRGCCDNFSRRTYSGWAAGLPLRVVVPLRHELGCFLHQLLIGVLPTFLSTVFAFTQLQLQLLNGVVLLGESCLHIFIHDGVLKRQYF